ncbi:MAG: LLM class flavin-dependent oxidoreductase, partial [Acetobacteraceae bacterium]|nr:LLM class flavin-dependent oxidoreductase [Acetobacteraceae bacterium]
GRFGDGHKVRRLDHVGPNFKSRGPFTVPRSPQGQPVIIQAGSSGRGRRFAARWSEVIFAAAHNLAHAQAGYKAQKDEIAAAGRDPEQVKMCNLILPVVAATKSEAEDKMALIEKLPLEVDTLSLLSEALNFDFASKPMDEAFTDDELRGMSGIQTIRDSVIRVSGISNPTVRDFAKFSGRGRADNAIVGGPKEVADHLEEMFVTRGCDGFVVSAAYVPGNYADFVAHVIPELQRRGLYHLDYAGETLRENLGLARPAIDAWKPRK